MDKEVLGVSPEDFMRQYEDMQKAVVGNSLCKRLDMLGLEHDELGPIQIYASHVNSPTRLISDRAFVDAKYMWPAENLILMSSHGNEKVREQVLASN